MQCASTTLANPRDCNDDIVVVDDNDDDDDDDGDGDDDDDDGDGDDDDEIKSESHQSIQHDNASSKPTIDNASSISQPSSLVSESLGMPSANTRANSNPVRLDSHVSLATVDRTGSTHRGRGGIACIKGEIHNVLTVLRVTSNSKSSISISDSSWLLTSSASESSRSTSPSLLTSPNAATSPSASSDADAKAITIPSLVRGLHDLHDTLGYYSEISAFDAPSMLHPFLAVLEARVANEQAKTCALQALHKFVLYGLLRAHSLGAPAAVNHAVRVLVRTSRSVYHSELVHLRVLELLLELVRCAAGHFLTDSSLCLAFEECFALRQRRSASILLEAYADDILVQFVLVIFVHLAHMRASPDTFPPFASPHHIASCETFAASNGSSGYGAVALERILTFLATLLNPSNNTRDVRLLSLRLLNTALETGAKAIARQPRLVGVVQDELCRALLQNSQSSDSTVLTLVLRIVFDLLQAVKEHLRVQLEVFFTSIHFRIAASSSAPLVHRELVLQALVELCHEPDLLVGLHRNYDSEVAATNLFEDLCRLLCQRALPSSSFTTTSSSIAMTMKTQTDSSIKMNDSTSLLIPNLTKSSSSSSRTQESKYDNEFDAGYGGTPSALHVLALEALLAIVSSLAKRFCTIISSQTSTSAAESMTSSHNSMASKDDGEDEVDEEELHQLRRRKVRLRRAASIFNELQHKSLAHLTELGVLPRRAGDAPLTSDASVNDIFVDDEHLHDEVNEDAVEQRIGVCMARFLRTAPHVDRHCVGAFLGRNDVFSIRVLGAYVDLFDFGGLDFVEGLRRLMESFVIPGESQQIERIMEQFARRYYSQNSDGPLADEDSACVLAYSVLMLNTDAHNRQVMKKMTRDEFARNNRGMNAGQDHDRQFLDEIFTDITQNEIMIVSEKVSDVFIGDSAGQLNSSHWAKIVRESAAAGNASFRAEGGHAHGRAMFALLSGPIVHIMAYYLEHVDTHHSKVLERCVAGCRLYARICAVYGLVDAFNTLIIALCKALIETLLDINSDPEGYEPMVAFGRNKRAQRLVQLVFNLVRSYGERFVLEAWSNVMHVVLWLRHLHLLPDELVDMDDFRDAEGHELASLRDHHHHHHHHSSELSSNDASVHDDERGGAGNSAMSYISSALLSLWALDDDNESSDDRLKTTTAIIDNSTSGSEVISDSIHSSEVKHLSYNNAHSKHDQSNASIVSVDEDEEFALIARDCVRVCQIEHIFSSANTFSPDVLCHLTQTLILVSTYGSVSTDGGFSSSPKPPVAFDVFERQVVGIDAAVFCLERLSSISQITQWDLVHNHLRMMLTRAAQHDAATFYTERVVVNVLRVCVTGERSARDDALRLLPLILELRPSLLHSFAERIMAGLTMLVKCDSDAITHTQSWSCVLRLLSTFHSHPRASAPMLSAFDFIVSHCVSWHNFAVLRDTCVSLAELSTSDTHCKLCIQSLVRLAVEINNLPSQCVSNNAQLPLSSDNTLQNQSIPDDTLTTSSHHNSSITKSPTNLSVGSDDLWFSIVKALCHLCSCESRLDKSALVKQNISEINLPSVECSQQLQLLALDGLQTLLMSIEEMDGHNINWCECFEHTLLPLLSSLRASRSLERASSLFFQVFLYRLPVLVSTNNFEVFWLSFVRSMCQAMSKPELTQHFAESLKNVLLVMSASNTFQQSESTNDCPTTLLEQTFDVINNYDTGLCEQLRQSIEELCDTKPQQYTSDNTQGDVAEPEVASGDVLLDTNSDAN